ncbi:MAG: erythromycin esterase family protein [Bdellovibrionales bacterium]|nr:erythromycin esterase family protein [Bdellovibrionales bacterium]
MKPIKNRKTAGILLSEKLKSNNFEDTNTLVLALPRGGVPVAYEVAKSLNLPLDVLFVKKVGAPDQPELAIGAIAEEGDPVWNRENMNLFDLTKNDLKKLAELAKQTILKQTQNWRSAIKSLEVKGKNVILVDDGLATGMTMQAAIDFLVRKKVKSITVAVPVSSQGAKESLKNKVDDVVVLYTPEPFYSVAQCYADFSQVSDKEVTDLLNAQAKDEEVSESIKILAQDIELNGELFIPKNPKGIVIFAHGSGSSRISPRNQYVAHALNQLGFITLLFDLLTLEESEQRENVFNIPLLSERLLMATNWIKNNANIKTLPIGFFGASTGAAAALVSAAQDKSISAVVSRGGRPELAGEYLDEVNCPTLLIVGGQDRNVLLLNQQAKNHLKQSEVVVIPGASHLFEEKGTLDQVVEHSADWFLKTLAKESNIRNSKPVEHLVEVIKTLATPIKDEKSLNSLLERLSHSRVVMLGEATHGSEEFYEVRKLISMKLIEKYGFDFIAVEGDWPTCYRLNKFIQLRDNRNVKDIMGEFKRWPTWMWANKQIINLIEWMRGRDTGFYGLDVYSLYESMDLVKSYATKLNPMLEQKILDAYSCFDFFDQNEIEYAKSLIKWPDGCEKEILKILREILRLRIEETKLLEHELFDIQQNAKIIHNAEKYYTTMIYGGADSWNVRDEHMMDTLDALLNFHGEGAKAIVWAHNTHIGDYHATDMLKEGYINLGGLARERYGVENVALVGFGTYEGKVLAAKAWESKPEIMRLPPAQAGSYEDYFHKSAKQINADQFYVLVDGDKSLSLRKNHRAVGVVYQPHLEKYGRNYVPTNLAKRYDAFVFIDKTSPLQAFSGPTKKGILPETWPLGF